jgi:hypothetical protein
MSDRDDLEWLGKGATTTWQLFRPGILLLGGIYIVYLILSSIGC